jgi:hypothetical protein
VIAGHYGTFEGNAEENQEESMLVKMTYPPSKIEPGYK